MYQVQRLLYSDFIVIDLLLIFNVHCSAYERERSVWSSEGFTLLVIHEIPSVCLKVPPTLE